MDRRERRRRNAKVRNRRRKLYLALIPIRYWAYEPDFDSEFPLQSFKYEDVLWATMLWETKKRRRLPIIE